MKYLIAMLLLISWVVITLVGSVAVWCLFGDGNWFSLPRMILDNLKKTENEL